MSTLRTAAFAGLFLLGGCSSNRFLDHYSGERHGEIPYATVTGSAPPNARVIGSSEFTAPGGISDGEALDAARTVGADYVAWGGDFDGTSRGIAHRPVTVPVYGSSFYYGRGCGRRGYGYGTSFGYATVYEPYEYAVDYYRYRATFYRSWSFDPYRPTSP